MLRDIAVERISFESYERKTSEQASELSAGKTSAHLRFAITLIPAPEHMKRTVQVIRKCGFTAVNRIPTPENSIQTEMALNDNDLKGNK